MILQEQRQQIIALIKREVVPALGCTEPVAVALCVARACELTGTQDEPDAIDVRVSANILKNAMGVGIPGTGGMIGLPAAVALGAIVGRSEYGLEVLRDTTDTAVAQAKAMIARKAIAIALDDAAPSKLHIDVTVRAGSVAARAIISGDHTNFVYLACNDSVLLNRMDSISDSEDISDKELDFSTVWDFALASPLDEIEFIMEAKRLNENAAREALANDFGHSVGATLNTLGNSIFGDTPLKRMVAYTAAACDTRMAGEPVPVMSNSGSGNQGITITMPVVTYAEEIGASHEQTVRALVLAHLTSIYIKQSLGRLSALCGCVVASTGASAALVYLMGGGYREATYAIKNMVANLTGMICDGAKPACALKIASGVSTAVLASMLAMNRRCVTSSEGIVDDDVDRTIHNLTSIGRDAMNETDRLVLKIMTSKQ